MANNQIRASEDQVIHSIEGIKFFFLPQSVVVTKTIQGNQAKTHLGDNCLAAHNKNGSQWGGSQY